jgi:glycopeptide antibiotics resistance protein
MIKIFKSLKRDKILAIDKLLHFLLFLFVTFLVYLFLKSVNNIYTQTIIISFTLGLTIELTQFESGVDLISIFDILANSLGIGLAIIIMRYFI